MPDPSLALEEERRQKDFEKVKIIEANLKELGRDIQNEMLYQEAQGARLPKLDKHVERANAELIEP